MPENAELLDAFALVPAEAIKLAAAVPLVRKNSLRPVFMLACTP